MKYIFHRGQKAPEFLIWANFKWGSGLQSTTDTADKIEESILRILNPRHIVNNLQWDLWDDIKEHKEHERGRTLIRALTVKKLAIMLRDDPLFLELFIMEFDKIESDRRLKAIINYNTYLKNDKWISPQYNINDPDLLEKWRLLDNFIYHKEQEIRGGIDNALNILENELLDIATDDTKIKVIQEDKKTVKHVSTKCECGGRYTQRNHFKHIRTERHVRHRQLLTHENTIKILKEGKNNLVIQIDD